jgi:hypothetical protein
LTNSLAARSKKIKNGDILTEINHESVKGLSERDMMAMLKTLPVALTFMRLPNARKVPLSLNVLPPVDDVLPAPPEQEPVYRIKQKEEEAAKRARLAPKVVTEDGGNSVEECKECTVEQVYNANAVWQSRELAEANAAFDRMVQQTLAQPPESAKRAMERRLRYESNGGDDAEGMEGEEDETSTRNAVDAGKDHKWWLPSAKDKRPDAVAPSQVMLVASGEFMVHASRVGATGFRHHAGAGERCVCTQPICETHPLTKDAPPLKKRRTHSLQDAYPLKQDAHPLPPDALTLTAGLYCYS